MVLNKPTISNVSKFHYLRSCLEGESASLVNSYPVIDDHFLVAWNKLKSRFENKKKLVKAHVSSIYSIKPMTESSSVELKRILNKVVTAIAALKVLKGPVNHWDDLLVFFIVSLFNTDIKKEWEIFIGSLDKDEVASGSEASSDNNYELNSNPPDFNLLVTFIERQISILESMEDKNIRQIVDVKNNNSSKKSRVSTTPVVKVLHAQVDTNKKLNDKCIICN